MVALVSSSAAITPTAKKVAYRAVLEPKLSNQQRRITPGVRFSVWQSKSKGVVENMCHVGLYVHIVPGLGEGVERAQWLAACCGWSGCKLSSGVGHEHIGSSPGNGCDPEYHDVAI